MPKPPADKPITKDQQALLDQLSVLDDGLPLEALRQADSNRSALTPVFLRELETYLAANQLTQQRRNPIFFIFHLLGSWRVQSAYPTLTRLLQLSPKVIHAVFGDAVSLTCHRVIISVFDGDPKPLHDLILDPNADELLRSRAFTALVALTRQGRIDACDTATFLRVCATSMKPQGRSVAWIGWQSAISTLDLSEMSHLVKDAFDRGFIDPSWVTYEHFLSDLGAAKLGQPVNSGDEYQPFGDTVDEMSDWSSFWPQT